MNAKQLARAVGQFEQHVQLAGENAQDGLDTEDNAKALRRFRTACEYLGQAQGIAFIAGLKARKEHAAFDSAETLVNRLEQQIHKRVSGLSEKLEGAATAWSGLSAQHTVNVARMERAEQALAAATRRELPDADALERIRTGRSS